ncbi:MAG TPA: serine hydrolase domain-containing protein [Puia sp.]|nr:serine hydrolase domain-containing protein [Puia sp.]
MNRLIFFLASLSFTTAHISQAQNISGLDSLFTRLQDANKITGSIAISKNGKMLYSRAIGYSCYSDSLKVHSTENTRYRIGSISKTFTSTIIFQLIADGVISLETSLAKYYPDFPNAGLITIGNLLNHRSGIRNYTKVKMQTIPRTREEMMQLISRSYSRSLPGTSTLYSNANYLILGYIIEKILNKPFGEVLRDSIVSKIGLTNTYFGHEPDIMNNESFSYDLTRGWLQQPVTDLTIPGASGGILSTPTDLTRFFHALFSKRLIGQSSLDQMKTITENYGMGMTEFEFRARKAYGQVGGIDHFESVVAYFPGDSLAVAFCTNGHAEPIKNVILNALEVYFADVHK